MHTQEIGSQRGVKQVNNRCIYYPSFGGENQSSEKKKSPLCPTLVFSV